MIEYMIPLLQSFLLVSYLEFWFFPLIAMAFLAFFPRFVRRLTQWS